MAAKTRISAVRTEQISIVHMSRNEPDDNAINLIPADDVFSVISQLQPFEQHRLWRRGKLVYEGGHPTAAIAITHLGDEWQCQHRSPFDNVRFNISRRVLDEFAYDSGRGPVGGLVSKPGQIDPVVWHLANAVMPALEQPMNVSLLFVDHIALALKAHLVSQYGGIKLPSPRNTGGLTQRQANIATAFLAEHLAEGVSVAEVAAVCGLSTSYFIRAFKTSMGRTPYRWLLEYRAEKARQMLLGPMPLVDIAIACGFADQSHLTRIFAAIHGISPGTWRRERRI
jgi:AraC-like DNA-binding protein